MKNFFKYIGENLRFYKQIKFTKNDEVLIRNSTINHLGLKNLNQLRDRYDGQYFFEKTIKNIGGLMALQKLLKIKLIDLNKLNLADFQPSIEIKGEKIDIIVFDFGTLPLLKVKDIKNPIYFIIQKDTLTFLLCGYATKDIIKENLIELGIVKSNKEKYMNFTGFKFLKELK